MLHGIKGWRLGAWRKHQPQFAFQKCLCFLLLPFPSFSFLLLPSPSFSFLFHPSPSFSQGCSPPCCSQGRPALAAGAAPAPGFTVVLSSPPPFPSQHMAPCKSAPQMSRVLLHQLGLLARKNFAVASNKYTEISAQSCQHSPQPQRGSWAGQGGPQRMERSCLCVHPSWGKKALRDVLNAHPARQDVPRGWRRALLCVCILPGGKGL